jgi:FAD/FMN-containing dehydrogenase
MSASANGTLDEKALQAFKAQLRGELIQLGDATYEEARQVYNGAIDKHPALIVRCVDVADVIAAVNVARDNGLLLAVRGGGHNGPGLGMCDGGLVIDLSRMRAVHVNPKNATVRVEGGCTWGDVDHATHAFGLAVPCGIISTTGVGGLALGGGTGYLTRKCGLTVDNLIGADVVLADGRLVTTSAEENSDLLWALRGGGGNFGVVTSFVFKAHAVSTVYAGPMLWPFDKTAEVMRWYRDFIADTPEDVYGWIGTLTVPAVAPFPDDLQGKKVCGIVWCYTGPLDKAEQVFKPIRKVGPPALDWVSAMPYPALNSLFDWVYPRGLHWYWKGDFFKDLSDEAIALHVKYSAQLPTPHSTMHLYPLYGPAQRAGKGDTAFSYREAAYSGVIVGVDPDAANLARATEWAKDYWQALHGHSMGGAYINFMMEEGQARVQATYRDNYAKLAEIKRKYDPTNLFRVNQNIKPA